MPNPSISDAIFGSWFAWPLWGFIATVAQVLSLLALGFAIYELLLRSRSVSGAFILNQFGFIAATGTEPEQHVVELINIGHDLAVVTEIRVVNAKIHKNADRRVKYALQGGESMTLGLVTGDPGRVWVRIQWVSPTDRRYIYGVWRVLWAGTPLETRWITSNLDTPSRHWWSSFVRTRFPRPIGPGADVTTRLRVSWNDIRQQGRLSRAFPEILEENEPWAIGSSQILPGSLPTPLQGG